MQRSGRQNSHSSSRYILAGLVFGLAVSISGCGGGGNGGSNDPTTPTASDGPNSSEAPVVHQTGVAASGRDVFRFETFGNERFWTDAIRLNAGMAASNFTLLNAMQLGMHVDSEMLDPALRAQIAAEARTDLSLVNAPRFNDPDTMKTIISANAVMGLATKDSNNDGILDTRTGDKTGATCALCHSVSDKSVFNSTNGGSIGRRLDGLGTHTLNFGSLVALGTNSRAFFPLLQLTLIANGGKTLGRAPTGLTKNSTEAEVDAYLRNPAFYPVGMFDDTFDGNGDPMHNVPLFRTDLAAPWGSDGTIARLDNFGNLVYTGLLDPTGITTPNGRAFVRKLGGMAAGDEIVDSYIQVLAATGVTGYPFVTAAVHPAPGSEDAPLGVRVDNIKLLDMNAYLNSLQAPLGVFTDAAAVARGRARFRTDCTSCHNVDQSKPVPAFVVGMSTIFPGDNPEVLLPMRDPPLNPILNTPGNIFDDKMAVVNASLRGKIRGTALPLLLDLARKPVFLHDNSVPTLDALLDPNRGATAPHPFFIGDAAQRADMIEFLRSLDTRTP